MEGIRGMPHIQMDRSFKGERMPGRVAFIATSLLPVLGVVCLLFSEWVVGYLPNFLGGTMLFVGVADIVSDLFEGDAPSGKITVGADVVMIVLGIVTLLYTAESLNVIAVIWGLLGLGKASRKIDEAQFARKGGGGWLAPLATGVFDLALGSMLLISPLTSIGHHVLLLGLELITFPFHLRGRGSGRSGASGFD